MAPLRKVALSGATGGLGPTIVKELVGNDFEVTLLTRKGSSSARSLMGLDHLSVVEVNYDDVSGLTQALKGIEAVICTIGEPGLDTQIPLVDAAVAAGVKRFIPSDFGADAEQEKNRVLPFYQRKIRILDHLKKQAEKNTHFSYTRVITHAFFDWGISEDFLANFKNHKITIYNGGATPFSVTNLSTIAKAIAGILMSPEATKNRPVYVHDTAITQNQLVRLAERVDGVKWEIKTDNTKRLLKESLKEFEKPDPDLAKAMRGLTFVAVYDEGHDPDLTSRLDNKLLGLPVMSKEEDVFDVVRRAMTQ